MTTLPAFDLRAQSQQYWKTEYFRHLEKRLVLSCSYIHESPRAEVRSHVRSFLTLLQEVHRYPGLTQKTLELISLLHPLPLRWGLGYLWEPELRFALDHTPPAMAHLRAEYHCDLGDVYLFRGQFEHAIRQAKSVLAMEVVPETLAARASRILFSCYRSTGDPDLADEHIAQISGRFSGDLPAGEVPAHLTQAWLRFNQCQLELLREKGEIEHAFELVEQMIWLDGRAGSQDKILTAELLTHRSTLLWVRAHYEDSVADLTQAISLYQNEDDQFNAESLGSNLGLVYWTMGDLSQAEHALRASIRYYRKTASDQLMTYDIGNLGLVQFARGELDEAMRLTRDHINHALNIHFISEYNRGLRNLGTILFYLDEYPQAIDALTTSHTYYEKRGSRDAYGLDVIWLALCLNQLGEKEKALAQVKEILSWSLERGSIVLEQVTLRCLAHLLPREERIAPLLRSLELARTTKRRLEEAAVQLTLGAACPDARQAQDYWLAGVQLLTEIGAEKWLVGRSITDPPFLPLLL